MKSIEEILKKNYSSLSKGQRKVADYLLEDAVKFGMSTAAQIAKQIDVSETTAIRLSYALGFESFSQMQKFIQKEQLEKLGRQQDNITDDEYSGTPNDFIQQIVYKEIEILQRLQTSLSIDDYWKAIDEIMNADEVKIVGYRASFAPAYWLNLKLSMLRGNVSLISQNPLWNAEELLCSPNKKVVYIILSFPSYVAETLRVAEYAKKQGAVLIAVSDRLLAPVSRISDYSLITEISVRSENLIPVSSVMTLLNILTAGIEQKYEEQITSRFKALNNLYKERGFFLE